jgi:O-antigen/teichoic acid export membrane protein
MLPIAVIYGLSVLAVARATPSAILYLFERFGTLSIQQPLVALARLFGAGMAYLTDAGLPGFIAAWMFAHLVDAGFHWAFAIREVHSRGLLRGIFKWPRGVTQEHKGLWSFSIATKLDRSVGQLGGRVAPLAVGFVLAPGAVALYHVALRLGMLLASPTMVLTRTIYPELANLAATADLRAILRVTLRTGAIAGVAVSPVLLLFVVFGDAILEAIGGAGFGEAHVTLVMIASAQVIALLALPLNAALQAIGWPGDALRVNAVATVSLIPVLLGLLWWVGLVGTGLHAIAISVAKLGGLGVGLFGARGEAPREPAS